MTTSNACTGGNVPSGAAPAVTASPPSEGDPNPGNDCAGAASSSTTTKPDRAIAKTTTTPTGGDKIVSTSERAVTYTLVVSNRASPASTLRPASSSATPCRATSAAGRRSTPSPRRSPTPSRATRTPPTTAPAKRCRSTRSPTSPSPARPPRRQYAAGAEVGYLLAQNLWLSAGLNVSGLKGDSDLTGYEYVQRGFYLRLRFKFDETLFKGRDKAVNPSLDR